MQADATSEVLSTALRMLAVASAAGLPLYAHFARGRVFAIFGAIVLGLSLTGALVTQAHMAGWIRAELRPWIAAAWIWGVVAATVHFAHLVRARLRHRVFRTLVSVPGQTFIAAGFLAVFWQLALWPVRAISGALGWQTFQVALDWMDWLPFALAVASIPTSARLKSEWVRVKAGTDGPERTERVPVERFRAAPPTRGSDPRGLRIVQIADPHLGPWQSVRSLQRILVKLLAHEPDLVLLTGDFLTMEGQGTPGALAEALSPLRAIGDRCYSIFGNHDHEASDEVRAALAANGIALLVDDEAIVPTPDGPLQIIGADYVGRGRRQHLEELLQRIPRREGHRRLLMLHDPQGFHDIPGGEVDLVLSGHTHGGQVGLVSLGLDWTVLGRSRWPDHGLFAKGSNRLYVHRGIGFYGFPLRIGVPGEASVLEWMPNR